MGSQVYTKTRKITALNRWWARTAACFAGAGQGARRRVCVRARACVGAFEQGLKLAPLAHGGDGDQTSGVAGVLGARDDARVRVSSTVAEQGARARA